MHETMAGKDMYSKLWNVVRMLLVLSDGQAAVERGFSINEKALRETQTCALRMQVGSVLHLCTKFEADCSIRSKVIKGVPKL